MHKSDALLKLDSATVRPITKNHFREIWTNKLPSKIEDSEHLLVIYGIGGARTWLGERNNKLQYFSNCFYLFYSNSNLHSNGKCDMN